jgi:hypothetical protein
MPDELRATTFGPGHKVLALVYTFERKTGGDITTWDKDWAPNVLQHLEAAGVFTPQ